VAELSKQSQANLRISTPTFRQALPVWASIGILNFGGSHRSDRLDASCSRRRKKSGSTRRVFLSALSFCMLLPGPEAMQLATYVVGNSMARVVVWQRGSCLFFLALWSFWHWRQFMLLSATFLSSARSFSASNRPSLS